MVIQLIKSKQVFHELGLPPASREDLSSYEQRYLPRQEASLRAYYHRPGSPLIFKTQALDINLAGACLCVDSDIRPGEKVKLKIYLSPHKSVETNATVVWKNARHDDYCYAGVVFGHLTQETQERILEYAFMPRQTR